MKPSIRTTICIFSSQFPFLNPTTISKINHQFRLFGISNFSTFQNPHHSSSQSSSFQSRRHEEESRNVRVSVWWDFENCSLPADANVFRASQSITAAIRANGIKGPIQITAFGDVLQLPRSTQEALSSTGINLTHIPHGGKNSADRSLLVDLMYWVSQNPPPAHLFVISGDKDFASILHRLRMSNYNILLASSDPAPSVLCSAASIMWQWNNLVKGENINGKHFNQPPDGPYGSWYGHYKLPLEDPFAISSKHEELIESSSDSKVRPVPKAVVKQICVILKSYPKGISIMELRVELGKSNINIDKDYYGYKRFSRFLLSMPDVLKVQTLKEGQQFVFRVSPKVTKKSEFTPRSVNGDSEIVSSNGGLESSTGVAPKVSSEITKTSEFTPNFINGGPESSEGGAPKEESKESFTKMGEQDKKESGPTPIETVNNNSNNDSVVSDLQTVEEQDSISESGFFRRIWRNLFGGKDKNPVSTQSTEDKKETEKKHVEFTSEGADLISKSSNNLRDGDAIDDGTSKDPGLFKNILTWCRFWKSTPPLENSSESKEEMDSVKIDDEKKNGVLWKESFWVEILEFIDSPKGSELVLQSRSRKQLAQNLQNQGPSILKTLSVTDLLHLINLLISDKNRIEVSPSQTFPFKLVKPVVEENSSSSNLRSIFSSTSSQSHEGDIRNQNLPHSPKKPITKTREDILKDCQNLVDGIVKEYPEGFNMGSFRKLFLETYGYHLDLPKIGHQKLVTLLQTMAGIKIESNYIIPTFKLSRENSPFSRENIDSDLSDSQWEELGPVSKTCPEGNETGLDQKSKDLKYAPFPTGSGQKIQEPEYEPLTDDVFSDSDDETYSSVVESAKSRMNEDDSSLLQILDSWYICQDDNNKQGVSEKDDLQRPEIGENPAVSYGRKQRPSRSYSFVADQNSIVDNKDKIIDGILGSLKKSSDRSRESTVGS